MTTLWWQPCPWPFPHTPASLATGVGQREHEVGPRSWPDSQQRGVTRTGRPGGWGGVTFWGWGGEELNPGSLPYCSVSRESAENERTHLENQAAQRQREAVTSVPAGPPGPAPGSPACPCPSCPVRYVHTLNGTLGHVS